MDYQGVLDYLKEIETKGIQPGLDNTRHILHHFPTFGKEFETAAAKTCFIQVAGTNGKGSTSHFLESIFRAAGYNVGIFTSPHLFDIRERMAINRQWISEEDFSAGFQAVNDLSESLLSRRITARKPSYFEYTFLMAMHYFFKEQVDAAILEVGLGGRWDATSTITPAVSVITTISKDHTAILGTRIRDIAAEKAAIIKKGVPVVCGCKVGTVAHRVIKAVAAGYHAPFFNVTDAANRLEIHTNNRAYHCNYNTAAGEYRYTVRLNGMHQAFNAAAAVKTAQVLTETGNSLSIPRAAIENGIADTVVPGRVETLETTPPVILDGGHNVESTSALVRYLEEKKKNNLTLVFGVLADKNYKKMVTLLMPFAGSVVLTEPLSPRALPTHKLVKLFNGKPVQVKSNIEDAYHTARQLKNEILVTGSFYLVGAMRKLILAGGK